MLCPHITHRGDVGCLVDFEPSKHRSIKNWEYVDDSYFTDMYKPSE
jgi:hypothetical protein